MISEMTLYWINSQEPHPLGKFFFSQESLVPIVLCLGVEPNEVSPFLLRISINIAIVLVLLRQPYCCYCKYSFPVISRRSILTADFLVSCSYNLFASSPAMFPGLQAQEFCCTCIHWFQVSFNTQYSLESSFTIFFFSSNKKMAYIC